MPQAAAAFASPFLAGLAASLGLEFLWVDDAGEPEGTLARRLDVAERLLAAGAGFVLSARRTVAAESSAV